MYISNSEQVKINLQKTAQEIKVYHKKTKVFKQITQLKK